MYALRSIEDKKGHELRVAKMMPKWALGQGGDKGAAMHTIMFCSLCGVCSSQVMRKLFKAPCQGNLSKSKHHLVHLQRGRHPIYNIPVDYKHKLKVHTFTEVKEAIKARRAVAEQFPPKWRLRPSRAS